MGKIIWTEKASAHLKAIHDYIAEDSVMYTTRFIKFLVKATDKLGVFPYGGTFSIKTKKYVDVGLFTKQR